MNPWPPVTRDDLKSAATSAGFDTVFPLLMRRLIAETAEGLTSLDMPGGSGTASGGFDGVVHASGTSAFVPSGTSVWELSVGGGQGKAEEDYSKRLDAPGDMPTQEVTYVEALLVSWTKARTWAVEKNKDGRWREVRAYNLDRIHAWLDQAPATTVWLAALLGKTLPGVQSLGSWWTDSWLPSTRVKLGQEIVLAGREKAADDLVSKLKARRSMITLSGDLRPDESCAFVAAALERMQALDMSRAGVASLFVSDANSLTQLVAQKHPMILLLGDAALARDLPVGHVHQLIMGAAPGESVDVNVPRLSRKAIESQLERAGVPSAQAARLGALGRRSLLALRRSLAYHPSVFTPLWAAAPDVIRRRLLLLGAWQADNTEDRQLVANCIGQPYEEIEEKAEWLSQVADIPFMGRVGDIWYVLSREDAWTLLASKLNADDLDAFRRISTEVFTELDPVLDMDPSERWMAGIKGKKRRFSRTLRRGLAESLALLAISNSHVQGTAGKTTAQFVRLLVSGFLSNANADLSYRMWVSLGDVLDLFAEAAPDEFLDAMRSGLSAKPSVHISMFADDKTDEFGLGTSSPHTQFLWALESLAWSPEHIDDVVDVLSALAAIDPGGRFANRPLASLVAILSAWNPNTAASTDDRIRCIRRVAEREPEVGRKLLPALIPNRDAFQTVHSGPHFRDWKRQYSINRGELDRVVDTVMEILIENLSDNLNICLNVIDKIDDIPPKHRSMIAVRLKDLGRNLPDGTERAQIFEAIREKIAHHREYSDAAWAFSNEQIDELQQACDSLAPKNPIFRHAWMFQEGWVTLGDKRKRDDFTAYEQQLRVRRAAAVGEIIAWGGIGALVEFADKIPDPGLIGVSLAEHTGSYDRDMLAMLVVGEAPVGDIASGYFYRRLRQSDNELLDRLLSETDDHLAQARILRFTGRLAESWEKLSELDPMVRENYWREFVYYGLGHDFPHAREAASALLKAGRPAAALDLLLLYSRNGNPEVETAQIIANGLESIIENGLADPEIRKLRSYHFEQMFDQLFQFREELGHQRIANLEWQFFPVIGMGAEAPTLHSAIVEDPDFFVELAVHCFRAESLSDAEDDLEEEERKRTVASRAFEILSSCRRVPGVTPDGQVSVESLNSWVDCARAQLKEVDRATVGDLRIGELLANSPAASDGSPLHEAVRDLLEKVRSEELERGVAIGVFNSRGVTTRGVMDGGSQEWELARNFYGYSERARQWPRTRKLFRKIADSYEADARRRDEEAERRRQGLGW